MTTRVLGHRRTLDLFRTLAAPAAALMFLLGFSKPAMSADPVTLTVEAGRPGAKIQSHFYGLMTEEINYAYEGGLYAELIRNRIFQDRSMGRGNAAPSPNP